MIQSEFAEAMDRFSERYPHNQEMVDLFQGQWSSKVPPEAGVINEPGTAPLYVDPRLQWAERVLGGFRGMRVLELGPLEGMHSYMLERGGAQEILAIEAHPRAFLRCLCVKEMLGLRRVRFGFGDFRPYLEENPERYSLIVASGVLYHQRDPWRLLELMALRSDRVFLWTHYYDHARIQEQAHLRQRFQPPFRRRFGDVLVEGAVQSYGEALQIPGFCGGTAAQSVWLTRRSIVALLWSYGFRKIRSGCHETDHPNGPALSIVAGK